MQGIKFLGTGSFLPETVLTNNDFSKFVDTSDEWIFARTGIKQRHFNVGGTNFDMGVKAALKALENSGLAAENIDMIIVTTCTPDFFYPSVSCLIQNRIKAVNASCLDINSACTGFISALDMASRYLAAGDIKNILIVSSEMLSPQVDYEDRATCILFGDGAAAVVVTADSSKMFYSLLGAEGDYFKQLYCRVSYKNNLPVKNEMNLLDGIIDTEKKASYLQMDGKGVYKFAVDAMVKGVNKICAKSGIALEDIDLVIPHQANIRIINAAMKALKIDESKVYSNLECHGNISSACIPLCIDELYAQKRIKPGMKLCIVGFGAGLTYGTVLMEI